MNIDNILYTPLDCPQQPIYAIEDIKQWAVQNAGVIKDQKELLAEECHIAERVQGNYPWDVTVVYRKFISFDPGWIGGFDSQFPELAKYFYEAFGLTLDDLGIVLLLPIKQNHTGLGFWHRDPDDYGLRMYLEYESIDENTLLTRSNINPEIEVQCKIASNKQCFFLNNKHATHTTYTTVPNKTRIAVLIIGKLDVQSQAAWKQKITPLVERSAIMYPNNAVLA